MSPTPLRQRTARLSLAAAILVVLVATLTPDPSGSPQGRFTCMLCDDAAMADAITNVVLFVPLGLALALNGRRGPLAILYAAALSFAIEMAQNLIPGRDPSLRDLLMNTLGGGVGQGVAGLSGLLLPDSRRAARLGLVWSACVIGCLGLTAALLAPAFPATTYYARWSPNQTAYEGRVLAANLGPLPLPPRRLDATAQVRTMLLGGDSLEILALSAPAVFEFRSLFRIRDDRHHEIIELGPDRDDLMVRYRTRAATWRLDQPDLRLPGAFAGIAAGDTLRIGAWRQRGGICLRMNAEGVCPTGFTVGSGWGLLWYPEHLPPWLKSALGEMWIAGFVLPIGLWSRRRPESLLAIGLLLAGLFILPPSTGLLATPPSLVLAAAGGWLLGALLQSTLRKMRV
jgi:VanZ family protein